MTSDKNRALAQLPTKVVVQGLCFVMSCNKGSMLVVGLCVISEVKRKIKIFIVLCQIIGVSVLEIIM